MKLKYETWLSIYSILGAIGIAIILMFKLFFIGVPLLFLSLLAFINMRFIELGESRK